MARPRRLRVARGARGAMVAAGVVASVLAGAGCGTGGPPAGSEKVARPSAVGDCLRPDPEHVGAFLQAGCEGGRATVVIVEIVQGEGAGARCPAGTDVVADAAAGPVSRGHIEGGPAVWCLRNLEPPHPGDAGMGGGELVVGDCFFLAGDDVTETPCAGDARARYELVASASRSEDCPAQGTEPVEMASPRLLVLCAKALGKGDDTAAT